MWGCHLNLCFESAEPINLGKLEYRIKVKSSQGYPLNS